MKEKTTRKRWTEVDNAWLAAHMDGEVSNRDLAITLGRTEEAIESRKRDIRNGRFSTMFSAVQALRVIPISYGEWVKDPTSHIDRWQTWVMNERKKPAIQKPPSEAETPACCVKMKKAAPLRESAEDIIKETGGVHIPEPKAPVTEPEPTEIMENDTCYGVEKEEIGIGKGHDAMSVFQIITYFLFVLIVLGIVILLIKLFA